MFVDVLSSIVRSSIVVLSSIDRSFVVRSFVSFSFDRSFYLVVLIRSLFVLVR